MIRVRLAVLCAVLVAAGIALAPQAQARVTWSPYGQAAYVLGGGSVQHDVQAPAPIASMAKTMTGYLVLRYRSLAGTNGFTMTVTPADVTDWRRRVGRGESTVPVRAGETLTERQAMAALLLPSANNIAIMLARRVSGSVAAFVALMNRTARALHMTHTTYTDPSGFDARTRSTAVDQLVIAHRAMTVPAFRAIVALRSYRIPVAGTVRSTDSLLGTDGFVGIKTGSMDASGGCFMFLSHRIVGGRHADLYGVVMGQPGGNLIAAALREARRITDSAAPAHA